MILKLTEWQSESGAWHCADVSALAAGSSRWEHQPRIWRLSPVDWVKMLINTFNATVTMSKSYHLDKKYGKFTQKFTKL